MDQCEKGEEAAKEGLRRLARMIARRMLTAASADFSGHASLTSTPASTSKVPKAPNYKE